MWRGRGVLDTDTMTNLKCLWFVDSQQSQKRLQKYNNNLNDTLLFFQNCCKLLFRKSRTTKLSRGKSLGRCFKGNPRQHNHLNFLGNSLQSPVSRTLLSWSSLKLSIRENAVVSNSTSSIDSEIDSFVEEFVASQENKPNRRRFEGFLSRSREDF